MTRFSITDTPLAGLKLIERQRLADDRGFLSRLFCSDELAFAGWEKSIAQINHTFTSKRGTVRGLHYQNTPHTEMKMVSCIRGVIWDVAVDLRFNSPTFMQWHAQILSEDNGHALLIPEGFAHGFQSLENDCELLYMHTMAYSPESEDALRFNEERLAISWPLPISEISARDSSHPPLNLEFIGIKL
jgi:dTDP-4-dehydrorhamnose 3,5-epimerase